MRKYFYVRIPCLTHVDDFSRNKMLSAVIVKIYFFLFSSSETRSIIRNKTKSIIQQHIQRQTINQTIPCLLLIKPSLRLTLRRMNIHLLLFREWWKLRSQRWSVRPWWLWATRTVPASIPRCSISQRRRWQRRRRRQTLLRKWRKNLVGMDLVNITTMRRTVWAATLQKDASGTHICATMCGIQLVFAQVVLVLTVVTIVLLVVRRTQ